MVADRRYGKDFESSQLLLRSRRKRRSGAASTRADQRGHIEREVDALRWSAYVLITPARLLGRAGTNKRWLLCDHVIMAETKPKAVVLLSGGLDSATVLAIANATGYDSYALSFFYGQRHVWELDCARRIAADLDVKDHRIAQIDLQMFGGSALTADISVPKGRSLEEMSERIPSTYVPARNTIFLSVALAWAEVLGSSDIFVGVNALDYSGYPDCRPEFIEAFEKMANLATKAGVEGLQNLKIRTPLISLSKAQIIRKGLELGVNFGLTSSCYDPSPFGEACGACDSCLLRQKGFQENGLIDPLRYREAPTRVGS
jgi:7-cyano-7-deazaguanine synthase